jgi:Tfp pilus assembly PilM family ATPase
VKADKFITLDIGAEGIRFALFVRHEGHSLELERQGYVLLEPVDGMAREAVVAKAVRRLMHDVPPACRRARISIEGQSVFFRSVKLPPVAPDKLEQTIRHEAVQNIPFPIDEVVWGSHVFDRSAAELEVLLVAAKAEIVDGLVHAVGANGLFVESVEAAPVALVNAVRCNYPNMEEPLLLVDVGPQSASLVFIDASRVFSRTLPVSAGALPQLLQEVGRSMAFHGQQGGRAPQRILLAGEGIDPDHFSERLGVPTECFNPLRMIRHDDSISDAGCLGVAVGLAAGKAEHAIGIELLPDALTQERNLQRRLPLWMACAGLVVLILALWIGGLNAITAAMQEESAMVHSRVKALEEVERELEPLEYRMAELRKHAAEYRAVVERRTFWIDALSELHAQLPEGMFLLDSEPLRNGSSISGMRVTVVSYLDKEEDGQDSVVLLRDKLRASSRFSTETQVSRRPTKRLFFRRFVLDVFFREPMPQ